MIFIARTACDVGGIGNDDAQDARIFAVDFIARAAGENAEDNRCGKNANREDRLGLWRGRKHAENVQQQNDPGECDDDEKLLFELIRASFNQRRKTLVNSVGNAAEPAITKEEMSAALKELGLDERIRGEALTLEQFGALANRLSDINH